MLILVKYKLILDVQLWCSHLAVDNDSVNNIKYSVN